MTLTARFAMALVPIALVVACDGGDSGTDPTTTTPSATDATTSEDGQSTETDGLTATETDATTDATETDATTTDATETDATDVTTTDATESDATDVSEDVVDPCADVTCSSPPSPLCVSSTELLVFTAPGTCTADDGCVYGEQRVSCPGGCKDGACEGGDPCADVTCATPPDDCHAATGTCQGGVCHYAERTGTCDDHDPCTSGDTCAAGACHGEAIACATPPAAVCADDEVLIVSAAIGACAGGACAYDTTEVACPYGCADDACLGDPCAGVTCATPPDACHAATGTCSSGVCTYAPLTTAAGTCDDGDPCTLSDACVSGACKGVPMVCDEPPAVACGDAATLEVPSASGACEDGVCGYDVTPVHCDGGCFGDACNAAPVARITCPTSAQVDSVVAFSGTASTDADGSVASYAFAFGDGATSAASASVSASHTFTTPGTYTVVLTATDDRGGSDTASCDVVITPYPDLVVSTSRELCGDLRFATFTLQGGAKVTCSTGELRIRARTIFVDPSSSIVLDAASPELGGGDFRLCNNYWGNDGRTGAAGGGHGTAGGKPSDTAFRDQLSSNYYDYVCRGCTAPAADPATGSATLMGVELGHAGGGGCRSLGSSGGCYAEDLLAGGRGGGALDLIATEKITILGALSAKGGDGKSSNYVAAGPGGGSGGGVELVAPIVEMKGTIDVSGGAGVTTSNFDTECNGTKPVNGGDGGMGRVKLLWGTSLVKTGTITGAVSSEGRLPPLTFRSSTHPDPTRWYADGFTTAEVAWDAPVADAQGYYWALTTSTDFAVTPANGTFAAEPHVSIPRSAFNGSGVFLLVVATVDASGVVSPVASTFTMKVEARPWLVSSTSHPTETGWYAATAVALSFDPPSVNSFSLPVAYRYRIDRKSTFDAAEAGWTETTSRALIATTDATGAALSSFVYYVHVLPVDAAGRTSKTAGLYRLQLGTAPAKSSFYGYVTSASGASLAGAKVRIEPFGLTKTTDANGYFIFSDLYNGPYVVTVTASGYATLTSSVAVGMAVMPWAATLSN